MRPIWLDYLPNHLTNLLFCSIFAKNIALIGQKRQTLSQINSKMKQLTSLFFHDKLK